MRHDPLATQEHRLAHRPSKLVAGAVFLRDRPTSIRCDGNSQDGSLVSFRFSLNRIRFPNGSMTSMHLAS